MKTSLADKRHHVVYVVDDDPDVAQALRVALESENLTVRTMGAGRELLAQFNVDEAGCLILDLRLPDTSGLKLLQEVKARWGFLPFTVILTGHGDVPTAVAAMKMGVVDYLEKPVAIPHLIELVQMGVRESHAKRHQQMEFKDFVQTLAKLSPREQRVLEGLLAGKPNKQIASELNLSHKTIATYRAGILRKFDAASLVEVVRMMERLGGASPARPEPDPPQRIPTAHLIRRSRRNNHNHNRDR